MTLQNMAVASLLSLSPSFVLVHTSTQPTMPGIPNPLNLPKTSSWQGACQHALMSWPGVSAYHAHARAVLHVQQQQDCERCGRQLGRRKNNEPKSSAKATNEMSDVSTSPFCQPQMGRGPQSQKAHQFPATMSRMACCSSKTGFLGRMGWQQGKKLRARTTNQHLPGPALLAIIC